MIAMCRDAPPGLATPVTVAGDGLVGPHDNVDMAFSSSAEPQAFPAQTQLAVSGAELQLDAHAEPAEEAEGHAVPAEEAEGHAVPAGEAESNRAHAVPTGEVESNNARSGVKNAVVESNRCLPVLSSFLRACDCVYRLHKEIQSQS